MTIQKFLHSCLLVTVNGRKLLIDPGTFSFIEEKTSPEAIGPVDVILLTHEHPDHFFPDALRRLLALGPATIVTHPVLAEKVRAAGFVCEVIADGAMAFFAGFEIMSFPAPHGALPIPTPSNVGFLINQKLFHPGDTLDFVLASPPDILALPVAGPWLTVKQAVDAATRLKPKTVIPIHDAIIKDFMLERMYENLVAPRLAESGIAFRPLGLNEVLQV